MASPMETNAPSKQLSHVTKLVSELLLLTKANVNLNSSKNDLIQHNKNENSSIFDLLYTRYIKYYYKILFLASGNALSPH